MNILPNRKNFSITGKSSFSVSGFCIKAVELLCLKPILNLAILVILISGCKASKKEEEKHIDVFGYIKGQLRYIDTVPLQILKISKKDSGNADTTKWTVKDVHSLTDAFLKDSPDEDEFNEEFSQYVIADTTLKTISLSYQNTKMISPFERVEAYIDPPSGEFKQVYILKRTGSGAQQERLQLLWYHQQGFTLIKTSTDADGQEQTVVEKVIWQRAGS